MGSCICILSVLLCLLAMLTSVMHDTVERGWHYLLDNYSREDLVLWWTFALALGGYVLLNIPFIIVENISYFRKYKIQPDKDLSRSDFLTIYWRLAWSYGLVILPSIYGARAMFDYIGISTARVLPAWTTVAWQIVVFFLIEDTWHFFSHMYMHKNKWLYSQVHIVHHHWAAPVGIASQYAHPIEILMLGMGTFMGPLVFRPHLLTVWLWSFLRAAEAVAVHCGYDLPFALEHYFPFYAGAAYHDSHHKYNSGNFSSTFRHWDWLWGTSKRFDAQQAKKNGGKAQ